MRTISRIIAALTLVTALHAEQPIETGTVRWTRDHDAALKKSQEDGKPVLVLFQEVPGCAGCRQFGKEVLSDPKLVQVIEQSFIPLLVYNNHSEDAALLKQYNEPSWNYQVVRFLDGEGKDIIPRKDRVWDIRSLSQRMVEVLEKTKQQVPEELSTLAGSEVSEALKQAAISQYCFWTGERVIGAIDGVHETEAGFLDGREVTRVKYDPAVVSVQDIHRIAAANNTGDQIYTDLEGYRKAPAHDQKRQLQGTQFQKIKMTNAQATKVNAWARSDPQKAVEFLTSEQKEQL
ncbi:MAG: VPGUxxT family thioredoxin-like (seleno)protein, type 2 [Verrucomicrobiota bacterium]